MKQNAGGGGLALQTQGFLYGAAAGICRELAGNRRLGVKWNAHEASAHGVHETAGRGLGCSGFSLQVLVAGGVHGLCARGCGLGQK